MLSNNAFDGKLCYFILNNQIFKVSLNLDKLTTISRDIGNQLLANNKYIIKSHVSNENFQKFLDFIVNGQPPSFNSDNIYQFHNLSQEFDIMKDLFEQPDLEKLLKISILKNYYQNCNDKSYSEEYIAMNLDFYLQKFSKEMYEIPITSLYNIFYHRKRILNDQEKAYQFITSSDNEKSRNNLNILLESLEASKLKVKTFFDAIEKRDEHFGFTPKIKLSSFKMISPNFSEFEGTFEEYLNEVEKNTKNLKTLDLNHHFKCNCSKNIFNIFGFMILLVIGSILFLKLVESKGNLYFWLAECLYNGIIFNLDKQKAAIFYKFAADKGNIKSMFKYGSMLYKEDGIEINLNESAHYFKKAADLNDITSMLIYGLMLLNGDGIDINKREAAYYFKKAADLGDKDSMYNYGLMLYKGNGIEMNKTEAAYYYKKWADLGDREAI